MQSKQCSYRNIAADCEIPEQIQMYIDGDDITSKARDEQLPMIIAGLFYHSY